MLSSRLNRAGCPARLRGCGPPAQCRDPQPGDCIAALVTGSAARQPGARDAVVVVGLVEGRGLRPEQGIRSDVRGSEDRVRRKRGQRGQPQRTLYAVRLPHLRGDYSETVAGPGPAFQFRDVNLYDLNLQGRGSSVGMGDNLHIVAEVGEFESRSGLFLLESSERGCADAKLASVTGPSRVVPVMPNALFSGCGP